MNKRSNTKGDNSKQADKPPGEMNQQPNTSKNNRSRNRRKRAQPNNNNPPQSNKENGNNQEDDAIEFALERINALQQELAMDCDNDESESGSELEDYVDGVVNPELSARLRKIDAKTLGFIACAHETMKYLTDQGIPRDNPMMVNLRNRLIQGIYKM